MAGGSAVNGIKPTPRIIMPNVKVAVPLVPLAKRKVPVHYGEGSYAESR